MMDECSNELSIFVWKRGGCRVKNVRVSLKLCLCIVGNVWVYYSGDVCVIESALEFVSSVLNDVGCVISV